MLKKTKREAVDQNENKALQKSGFSMSEKIFKVLSLGGLSENIKKINSRFRHRSEMLILELGKVFGLSNDTKIRSISEQYKTGFLKKELKNYVDKLDIKEEELREKIHFFVNEIFESEDISSDILYIITMMKDILGEAFIDDNMDSFAHVLESVFTCSRMPEVYDVKKYLDENFPGVSQTEFMILVTLFHDLKKAYKPSQYLDPIDAIRGGHLSSHQWDGAKFLMEEINDIDSDIYNYFKAYLKNKGIDESKLLDLGNIIVRIIIGHAGNTEFIQIDTARTLLNILNFVEKKFESIEDFKVLKNRAVLFIEDVYSEDIVSSAEVDFLKNLKRKKDILYYMNRLLIQKYIQRNIGKDIGLRDIDIKTVKKLCNNIDKYMNKEDSLWKLLEDRSNAYILEDVIFEKKELWRTLDDDINTYLHPTSMEDSVENKMRLLFNINDIQSYIVPSSASFRKLLYHNTIDRLLSSPINGAVDVLAQLQLGIERSDSSMERGFYQAMYYNGITNLRKMIKSYHIKMNWPIPEDAPEKIKKLGNTYKEAYEKAYKVDFNTPEELGEVKGYFVDLIDDLCGGLDTEIVYPSIKLDGQTLLCDGLGDLAYSEAVDVFSKILVDESIDTIRISKNMTTNQKRILYNMVTSNYPLLEILRLAEKSHVVNVKFSVLQNMHYEFSHDFIYNVVDSIKNILISRFDEFYEEQRYKGRVVRNDGEDITFSMPSGEPLNVLFPNETVKKQIIKVALENNKSYLKEYSLKVGKTVEQIMNTVTKNIDFGIGYSYVGEEVKDSDKIDAFYEADIMSRQGFGKGDIELLKFSIDKIRALIKNVKDMEENIIQKYSDSMCNINNVEHKVIIEYKGEKRINPILFRYIKKYSGKSEYTKGEILNIISYYIDVLDKCFEFISLFVNRQNPFQEVTSINSDFGKGEIKTKNITQNYKGTYARQSLLELTSGKPGLRMIIDIKGMSIDNIELFKQLADKIEYDKIEKSDFIVMGYDITAKFVKAVDIIKEKYPEAIISLGGYEKYLYLPSVDDIDGFASYVSNVLDDNGLRAKLSYEDKINDSRESYSHLTLSNKLALGIEKIIEENIYALGLQDKLELPKNISMNIPNELVYILDDKVLKENFTIIVREFIELLLEGKETFDIEKETTVGTTNLQVNIKYDIPNMNISMYRKV